LTIESELIILNANEWISSNFTSLIRPGWYKRSLCLLLNSVKSANDLIFVWMGTLNVK